MTFTDALQSLRRAQKTSRGVSLYTRWVNRPLGRVLAAAAATAGLSPNTVTVISAVVTAAGLVTLAVAPVSIGTGIAVAVLLVLGFALDSADGQVARLTGTSSPAGEWLDHVVDAGKMTALHAAVLIALWRNGADAGWLGVVLAYQLVSVVFFAALTLHPLLQRGERVAAGPPSGDAGAPSGDAGAAAAAPSPLRAVGLLPADYGVLAASFVLWGAQPVFLVVYTALFVATTLIAAALSVKWFRSLSIAPG
ncbi:CDP-alcohol phosphatidyltransferase family protein [Microbacterium sp. YJN-G]|uniref:CDP-alcohol phosphatidyltransferase family protein n=1 Tax=Microbacterium sp. YJN-G TaxID=2763257 RepID=UPI001877A00A|nr:CDP-alcohol phosphatidyltransferase family protein [Microbacterium sp. YJN-G]